MQPLNEYSKWPAAPKAERPAPQFASREELHAAPHYGKHICPACWGAGWMSNGGELVACDRCKAVETQRLNRMIGECWQLSGLKPSLPAAPTLDNFETRDAATTVMLSAAKRFAARPIGWLTIYGAWGSGKSHLAEAITRFLLGHRVPCVYVRAPDLYAYLGATERSESDDTDYAGRLAWIKALQVVCIDECGKETASRAVQRLRTELLDTRWRHATQESGGATVLVSNDPPDAWPDPAIADRAMDSRFVQIEATAQSYRRLER